MQKESIQNISHQKIFKYLSLDQPLEGGDIGEIFPRNYFRKVGDSFNRLIVIREYLFSSGFYLTITARGKVPVPLENLVDLDALNNLVLGKK